MQKFYCIFALVLFFFSTSSILYAEGEITDTITAGENGNYADIKAAFDAINTVGLSGEVVLKVISNQTLTAPAVLNAFDTTAALKIISTGDFTITSAIDDNGTLEFNNCSNVEVDGNAEGVAGERNLIIEQTGEGSSSDYAAAIQIHESDGIIIRNTILRGGTGNEKPNDQVGIFVHEDFGLTKNVTVDNCQFDRGEYGAYILGNSTTTHDGFTFTNNLFKSENDNEYLNYGVRFFYVDNLVFSGNEVDGYSYDQDDYKPMYAMYASNVSGTGEFNNNSFKHADRGVYLTASKFSDTVEIKNNIFRDMGEYAIYCSNSTSGDLLPFIIDGNDIKRVNKQLATTSSAATVGIYLNAAPNSVISNNIIGDIQNNYTGTGNYPGYAAGIFLNGGNGSGSDNVLIYHNNIYNVYGRGTAYVSSSTGFNWWYAPAGIMIRQGSDIEIYQNTVKMGAGFTNAGQQGAISSAVLFGAYYDSTSGHKLYNNILVNNMSGNGTESFVIYTTKRTSEDDITIEIAESDFNALSTDGTTVKFAEDQETYAYITDWQTAGYGANSTGMQIDLTADGHLDGEAALSDALECPAIADLNITTDVDGEERGTGNTIMGVDIVNLSLELTDDLMVSIDKPEGLCDGTQNLQFVFGARGIFEDGIERNIGDALNVKWYLNDLPIRENDEKFEINGRKLKIIELDPTLGGDYRAEFWVKNLTPISTSAKTITVVEPVSIVSENMVEKYTGCEGFHDLTLSVETHNELSVQWQKEVDGIWEDIEGETNHSFTLDFTEMTKAEADGKYRAKITGDELCEPKYPSVLYTDTETEVELYLPITEEKMEYYFDNENLCGGMDLEFYAEAKGTVRGYQWQKLQGGQWYDISNSENATAQTQNFVIRNINETNTGAYRCKVLGNAECYDEEVFTESVDVNIPPQFNLVGHPESQVICGGERVEFNVIGNGLGEVKSYQWYKDGKALTTNDFAQEAMLIIEAADLSNVGEYSCEVVVEDCRGEVTYTSESAILYVLQETKVTRQPQPQQVALGEDVTLAVEAHMKGLVPPYYQHDFQWYKDGVALEDNDRIQGSHSSLLTILDVEASDFSNDYYCLVKGQCGNDETVRVSISDAPTVNITAQPQGVEVCASDAVTLEVEASSTDASMAVSYQWFFNGVALSDDTQISGSLTNKLTIQEANELNEGVYTVEASLTNGAFATSSDAEVTVNVSPVVMSFTGDISVEEEESIRLEIELEDATDVTYAWYKDAVEITGATESVLELDSAQMSDAGEYYCVASNGCGATETSKAIVSVTKKTSTSVIASNADGSMNISNEPNPFAVSTNIKFELLQASDAKLKIYDSQGNELAVIFNGMCQAGLNTVDFNASDYGLSSGSYFYTLEVEGKRVSKTMILVK